MSILLTSVIVGISILAIIILTSRLKLDAFISLFLISVFLAVAVLPSGTIVKTIQQGFGNTMASIGLLIIFGSVIGIILHRTGGALSIAGYVISKTGEKRSAEALGITGFITGLPIFCDAGFIILSGLAKSLSSRSKLPMPFMASAMACSLYSVHCLIPPHPGVLAASGVIEVNLGYLIAAGILLAVPGALSAYFWSRWMSKGKDYSPATVKDMNDSVTAGNLPSPLLSVMPVIVPLLLITLRSAVLLADRDGSTLLARILKVPGEPVFALAIGAAIALLLLKERKMSTLNSVFSEAVLKAGPILIITAAGGMFGMVIQATGIGESVGKLITGTSLGLMVPFIIAVFMKTAQGSSTVAIITTASLVSPMLGILGLDSEWGRMLTMLSMGAGSMIVSHANDSYFWVVTNFSDIKADASLRVYSSSTLVMGLVVFACVLITSLFTL